MVDEGESTDPEATAANSPPEPAPPGYGRYHVQITRSAYAPLIHEDGSPRQVAPYAGIKDACAICPARCCSQTVRCSSADVIMLCADLQVPFEHAFELVPGFGDRSFPLDERLVAEDEPWPGCVDFALRRVERRCMMLVKVGGYDRCGVYGSRPSTCRLYPIAWTSDVARGAPHVQLCPVPYGVTERVEASFLADCDVALDGWEIHLDLRKRWCQEVPEGERTAAALLAFVLPETAVRMGREVPVLFETRRPEQRLVDASLASRLKRPGR